MTDTKNCKDMQSLLTNEFISHYGLPIFTIENWSLVTKEKYFEIEDTNEKEIILHLTRGQGIARFSNDNALHLTILNYDKFITAIPSGLFKNGKKRCDIIIHSSSDRCFIL